MRHHSSAQELSSGIPFDGLTVVTDEEDDPENIYDVPTLDEDATAATIAFAAKPIRTKHSSKAPFATLPVSCSIASVKPLQPSCEIYDYDIYYSTKHANQTDTINTTTTSSSHNTNSTSSGSKKHYLDTIQRKKATMYSPRHYHPGGSSNLSTGNRPNSRNSLNSRLSSSHNSLSVPTANKADDSIFITQAMSHDTLTGREISDFYNVPIDSDMYSLPVDMVVVGVPVAPRSPKLGVAVAQGSGVGYKNFRTKLKSQRQQKKRKKHSSSTSGQLADDCPVATEFKYSSGHANSKLRHQRTMADAKRYSVPENSIEPMHMSLDEVKRFYHSLYSSSSDGSASDVPIVAGGANAKAAPAKKGSHFCTNSSPSSGALSTSNHNNNHIVLISPLSMDNGATAKPMASVGTAKAPPAPSPAKKKSNKTASGNTPKTVQPKNRKASTTKDKEQLLLANTINNNHADGGAQSSSPGGVKIGCGGKKSQFSINLNLKQKFCSIFRFRRSGSAHITSATSAGGASGSTAGIRAPDDYEHTSRLNGGGGIDGRGVRGGKQSKNPKFMTRALPPLPNKGES